jgi:glycosyltransferase involved in cell wall biosynthesis
MYNGNHICAVIPARDEAPAIAGVINDLKKLEFIDRIIVCDNGSSDDTAKIALTTGVEVITQPIPGYGYACMQAISIIDKTDVVLFVDADASLQLDESPRLLDGIDSGADIVIGTRIKKWQQTGSMTMPQRFGNNIASLMINLIWQYRVSDLGPFRAIRFDVLKKLEMGEKRFGWTVEMQVKAIQYGLQMVEVPVHYQRRIGRSKISGTLKGVIGAGIGIIGTIIKLAIRQPSRHKQICSSESRSHPPL